MRPILKANEVYEDGKVWREVMDDRKARHDMFDRVEKRCEQIYHQVMQATDRLPKSEPCPPSVIVFL